MKCSFQEKWLKARECLLPRKFNDWALNYECCDPENLFFPLPIIISCYKRFLVPFPSFLFGGKTAEAAVQNYPILNFVEMCRLPFSPLQRWKRGEEGKTGLRPLERGKPSWLLSCIAIKFSSTSSSFFSSFHFGTLITAEGWEAKFTKRNRNLILHSTKQ